MEALDLRQQPPRSPRLQVAGLCFMGRTIDKTRALLPGGNIGAYHIAGASTDLLQHVGITLEQLKDVVATAASDEEIALWLHGHADLSTCEQFNGDALTKRPSDVEPWQAQAFRSEHAALAEVPIRTFADALELDDHLCFALPF